MECFELIRTVLDEEYGHIAGTEAEKDAAITNALAHLQQHYARVTSTGPCDYRDRATRFAYIYRYTTAHANLVYRTIRQTQGLARLFNGAAVEIACIGGGPGSDYLGILKYLIRENKRPKLRCNLFDRESAWFESWCDVDCKVEPVGLQLSLRFIPFDVTEPAQWQPHTKYFESDLVTFIYFLSEVVKYKDKATLYFNTVLQRAKAGAFFLFIDNNFQEHYGWFDAMAENNALEIVAQSNGLMQMPVDEEKTSLGRYYTKFPDPKLNSKVAVRLACKRGI